MMLIATISVTPSAVVKAARAQGCSGFTEKIEVCPVKPLPKATPAAPEL